MITGDMVRLRPFVLEDIDFLLRWNNDPEYSGVFEPFEPVSREELEEWIQREKPGQLWYIIGIPDGVMVGQIVGRYQDDGSVQIGYRIIPSARGEELLYRGGEYASHPFVRLWGGEDRCRSKPS